MNPRKLKRDWDKACGKAADNPNSWQDKMDRIERETFSAAPEGSFRTMEYAARKGLSKDNARAALNRLERLGKVRKIKAPGSNVIYWIPLP